MVRIFENYPLTPYTKTGLTPINANDTRLNLSINDKNLTPLEGAKNELCAIVPGISVGIFNLQACLFAEKIQFDPPTLLESTYQVSSSSAEVFVALKGCMSDSCTDPIGTTSIATFQTYGNPFLRFWRISLVIVTVLCALVCIMRCLGCCCCCNGKKEIRVVHTHETYSRMV
jgi:hypothetical protein